MLLGSEAESPWFERSGSTTKFQSQVHLETSSIAERIKLIKYKICNALAVSKNELNLESMKWCGKTNFARYLKKLHL